MFMMLGTLPVAGLRLVNPCQVFTAGQLQRIIMERSGVLTALFRAIPRVSAFVVGVTVDCSTGTVAITMVIRFFPSGATNVLTGFAQLNAVLEPIPIIATARPGTICLRFGGRRFVDVTSFPDAVLSRLTV